MQEPELERQFEMLRDRFKNIRPEPGTDDAIWLDEFEREEERVKRDRELESIRVIGPALLEEARKKQWVDAFNKMPNYNGRPMARAGFPPTTKQINYAKRLAKQNAVGDFAVYTRIVNRIENIKDRQVMATMIDRLVRGVMDED